MTSWRKANLILPNRTSLGLAAVLLAMWYAGASQNNGAAYLLCFVVVSIALVSLPHTWANLRGLALRAEVIRPVFSGEEMRVPLVADGGKRKRFGISLRLSGATSPLNIDLAGAPGPVRMEALTSAPARGLHQGLRAYVSSTYPLGFFTARRQVELNQPFVVYPQAVGDLDLPISFDPAQETREGARAEGDDYAGVRNWIPGESMRHIDWKAVSRGLPMMTKQWTSEAGHRLLLDWASLGSLDLEAKLSQLARWIVEAENRGMDYGLRLPTVNVPPGRGESHFHICLRALAVFPEKPRDARGQVTSAPSAQV